MIKCVHLAGFAIANTREHGRGRRRQQEQRVSTSLPKKEKNTERVCGPVAGVAACWLGCRSRVGGTPYRQCRPSSPLALPCSGVMSVVSVGHFDQQQPIVLLSRGRPLNINITGEIEVAAESRGDDPARYRISCFSSRLQLGRF